MSTVSRSAYFDGPFGKDSPSTQAFAISKTAWMDLYFDLYNQTHGDATQKTVIADVKNRLRILKANKIR